MRAPKFVAVTVFCGLEHYLLDREKEKALNWPGRMVESHDGKDLTESELISALTQFTLDGGGVAVVVDNAERVKVGQAFLDYMDSRDPKDTSSVLVAIIRQDTPPKAWESVAAKGRLVAHKRFKPWEHEKIEKRVLWEAKLLNLQLDSDALKTLLHLYGGNTGGMANEMRKLSFVVKAGGTVTRDHILKVCSRQVPVQPWDISEAAAKKQPKRALQMAGLLFKYEGEGAAVPILASLMKEVERLLIARDLLDRGVLETEVAAALKIHPFVFKKNVQPLVSRHSTPRLITQMKKLCELETRVKGAAMSKRTLVEAAILSLAE